MSVSVRLPVRLSDCHTCESCLNSSRYWNMLITVWYGHVSSSLRPNFTMQNQYVKDRHLLETAKIWPISHHISETVWHRMHRFSHIGSHIRAFHWYQNQLPRKTLNAAMAVILPRTTHDLRASYAKIVEMKERYPTRQRKFYSCNIARPSQQ